MTAISEKKGNIKYWWVYLLIGILFVFMGFYVIPHPVETYLAMSIFFATIMLVGGILQIVVSLTTKKQIKGWGWQLAMGIMETILGIFLVSNMDVTLITLPFFVGFWMMFRSIDVIGLAFEFQTKKHKNWGWYLALGIIQMILSWLIIFHPVIGVLTVIYYTAFALLFSGISYIMLSLKFNKENSKTE